MIDLSYFTRETDGKRIMLLHMVDETSRFHVVRVVKQCVYDSEEAMATSMAQRSSATSGKIGASSLVPHAAFTRMQKLSFHPLLLLLSPANAAFA